MRLLLVEDDPGIRKMLEQGLAEDRFEVEVCSTAEQAMQQTIRNDRVFHGFVLDILLPGLNGLELCRWLRGQGHNEPILMLISKGNVEEKIRGLDAGANDYLSKPFQMRELHARLDAVFRQTSQCTNGLLTVDDLVLNPLSGEVRRGGLQLRLSSQEASLLEYLMRNHMRVVTREMISKAVWDDETGLYSNIIDVFVAHLRKRLHLEGRPDLLTDVRRKGFRLSALGTPQAEIG